MELKELFLKDKLFSQYEIIILTSDPYIKNDYINYDRLNCIGLTVTPENLYRCNTALDELFSRNHLSINEFTGELEINEEGTGTLESYDTNTCTLYTSKTNDVIIETTTINADDDSWSLHLLINWQPRAFSTGYWGKHGMGIHRLLGQGIPITNPIKNMKYL